MENASKALIIAGAILISIILISIGILVVNGADSVVGGGQEQLDAQAIQAFNAQFMNYAGNKRGSTVNTLMNAVISSNATHEQQIEIAGDFGNTPSAVIGAIRSTTNYKVTIETDATSGLVNKITVNKIGSSD